MQKKISIIITLFFICILASWFIQRQAALYDVPVIEIERVRIEEDQQLITGRLMNTDQKGEVISLTAPYQKNQIETANITTRQIYLVQMHGDEWQLVAKKMMAGFFLYKCLHWHHVAYWWKTGRICFRKSHHQHRFTFTFVAPLYQNRRYFSLKYSNLICRYRDNR